MSIQQRLAFALAVVFVVVGCSKAAPPTPTALPFFAATPFLSPTPAPPTAPPVPDGTWEHPFLTASDVTVGDARWRVLEAQTASALIDTFLTRQFTPQGKFVIVAASVENVGLNPQTVPSLNIVDEKHRRFAPSTGMLQPSWMPPTIGFETLNPNLPRQYSTIFDLPSDSYDLRVTVSDLALLDAKVAYVLLNVEQRETLPPTATPRPRQPPWTATVAPVESPTATDLPASSTPIPPATPTVGATLIPATPTAYRPPVLIATSTTAPRPPAPTPAIAPHTISGLSSAHLLSRLRSLGWTCVDVVVLSEDACHIVRATDQTTGRVSLSSEPPDAIGNVYTTVHWITPAPDAAFITTLLNQVAAEPYLGSNPTQVQQWITWAVNAGHGRIFDRTLLTVGRSNIFLESLGAYWNLEMFPSAIPRPAPWGRPWRRRRETEA